ncbi:MAG: sugar porter family MFS transporter [Phycisphaerae bacterium]|nr:sugar porter family MFS transporter [Phycisphaerae bacterium]
MYIAEVSPAKVRGRFVSINQLTIVIGVLAAQIINVMIDKPTPTADDVRILANPQSFKVIQTEYEVAAKAINHAQQFSDDDAISFIKEIHPDIAYLPTLDAETHSEEQLEARKKTDQKLLSDYILNSWNGQKGWRWMFAAETVPAGLFFLLMFFIPESPRWLIKYGKAEKAKKILEKIGGLQYANFEVADIQKTVQSEDGSKVRFNELLESKMVRILGIGVFLAVFQQWCGINVIFNYAEDIFREAGYTINSTMDNIVKTGIVNLVFTFVAIFTVDKIGRKPLMLVGSGGLAVIYAVFGACYYYNVTGTVMLVLVLLAIACYSMSLAPIVWVVISEIFPNRIRGAAMAIAVSALWIACTILTFTFSFLNKSLGAHGTFWLYGIVCVIGFFFVYFKLPETKGKSLEEIERELAK